MNFFLNETKEPPHKATAPLYPNIIEVPLFFFFNYNFLF